MIMSLSALQGIVRPLRSCLWSAWGTTVLTTPSVDCSQRSIWCVAWTSKSKRTTFHIDCVSRMQFLSWNRVFHHIFFSQLMTREPLEKLGFQDLVDPPPGDAEGDAKPWAEGHCFKDCVDMNSAPQCWFPHHGFQFCKKISRSNVHFGPDNLVTCKPLAYTRWLIIYLNILVCK